MSCTFFHKRCLLLMHLLVQSSLAMRDASSVSSIMLEEIERSRSSALANATVTQVQKANFSHEHKSVSVKAIGMSTTNLTEVENINSTECLPSPDGSSYGCKSTGCLCASWQRCYTKFDKSSVNAGICSVNVTVMVLFSIFIFGGLLASIVVARAYFQWQEMAKDLQKRKGSLSRSSSTDSAISIS
eukprot:TRINITY_DN55469_c0_g1_i1.p1 TRINITY_DN55469_c0_g1~~TRINITY_DN55469_c0_g1_i1.p1  ORF type:complete len:186 (-),score=16.70 TRINITY_DN55469_c0_g1_i1:149-706(-)